MLLIDRLYREHPRLPKPDAVIKVHDLADLIFNGFKDKSPPFLGMKDVECLRLPYKVVWFEFFLRTKKAQATIGILSIEKKLMDHLTIRNSSYYFMEGAGDEIIPIAGHHYDCGTKGEFIHEAELDQNEKAESEMVDLIDPVKRVMANFCAQIELTALNFLHCKNVRLISNPLRAMDIKRRKQEGKDYFEKFYTLEILRVQRVSSIRPGVPGERIVQGQHVCRGHLKHYEKKPLFGIFYGTYFWPSHVRGSAKVGKITKDYKMTPAKTKRGDSYN